MAHHYIPLYRPAGFATLPPGIRWEYVEAPAMSGLCRRDDIKQSSHRYGVIATNRALTPEEREHFDLRIA